MIGLMPSCCRGFVKVHHPEHGAVVGDRDGGHLQFLDALDELLDVRETIQQGVFCVNVKMCEGHGLRTIIARMFKNEVDGRLKKLTLVKSFDQKRKKLTSTIEPKKSPPNLEP